MSRIKDKALTLALAGKAVEVGVWFASLGLPPPLNINLADFVLDIASGEIRTALEDGQQTRQRCIAAAKDHLEESPEGFGADILDSNALSTVPGEVSPRAPVPQGLNPTANAMAASACDGFLPFKYRTKPSCMWLWFSGMMMNMPPIWLDE